MNSAVRYDPVQLAQRISGVTLWNSTEAILFLMLLSTRSKQHGKELPSKIGRVSIPSFQAEFFPALWC
jgi:hypothetical protein